MKVKITQLYRSFNKKDGTPLVNKKGNPYERVSIKTDQHGEVWIGGFGDSANKEWKIGDTIDVEIAQNGVYWNFKEPNQTDVLKATIENLKAEIKLLHERLSALEK